MHGGHAEMEGCGPVRRFAWQIGGLGLAVGACVVLGVVAFGCGGSAPARPTATASPTPRLTATPDPRAAQVDAAVRRYVQVLADSMRTGSAQELDDLSVPGSQAQGNAGVAAGIVQTNHVAFIATAVVVTRLEVQVNLTTATAAVDYRVDGYDADWPSLKEHAGSNHSVTAHSDLELALVSGQWLVDRIS